MHGDWVGKDSPRGLAETSGWWNLEEGFRYFSVLGIFSNYFYKVAVPIESNDHCAEEFKISEHPE